MTIKARAAIGIFSLALAIALCSCSVGDAAASSAKASLKTSAPTAALVKDALSNFTYDSADCSGAEAKKMLAWIGAKDYSSDESSATGQLGSSYYLTIWGNTYGYTGVYGFRYGLKYSTYWSSNSTYFEIAKW